MSPIRLSGIVFYAELQTILSLRDSTSASFNSWTDSVVLPMVEPGEADESRSPLTASDQHRIDTRAVTTQASEGLGAVARGEPSVIPSNAW
jgi:hypothetical protein